MGRQGNPVRGGMGVCCAGRPGWGRFRMGQRAVAGRAASRQHVAGRVSVAEPYDRWLRGHVTGRRVPSQRLRVARHDRQRLGMDTGRLPRSPCPESGQPMLRTRQSNAGADGSLPRVGRFSRGNPSQGGQGWLSPLRPELLPPLSAGGPATREHRHLDMSYWVSLRNAAPGRRCVARPIAARLATAARSLGNWRFQWSPFSRTWQELRL